MLSEHWDDYSGIFRSLAFVNGRRVGRHHHIEFTESVFDGSAVEANSYFPSIGVDIVNGADVAVVNLLVVVVLDLHHLVAGGKSPAEAGLSAACSSMFSERAPTPPRFIGHRTWMSRMGSRPNRFGMRIFANSMMRLTAIAGSSAGTK